MCDSQSGLIRFLIKSTVMEDYNVGFGKKHQNQTIHTITAKDYSERFRCSKAVVPLVLRSQVLKHAITIVIDIDVNSIEETLRGNSVFNSTALLL